jgi:hypothetical protein
LNAISNVQVSYESLPLTTGLIADVIANGWGAAYGLRAEGCQPSYAAGQTLACLRS